MEGLVNLFVQILDKVHVRDAIDCPPESILLRKVGKLTSNVRERAVMSGQHTKGMRTIPNSCLLPFQCIKTHSSAFICVNIITILKLGVDNIDQFVDFGANIITSLFVVLGALH
jgi:hypothetical protein